MKLEISLTPKGLDEAIKKLNKYEHKLTQAVTAGRREIAKTIREEIATRSGRAAGDMMTIDEGNTTTITTSDPVLTYQEFGTGIVGSQNPHPGAGFAGWRYDVNEHGEKGWVYMGDDGRIHWTKGMPPRAFMENSVRDVQSVAVDIMAQAIRDKLGGGTL